MICTHTGKLPLSIRLSHAKGELTHTKCPTCSRVIMLNRYGGIPKHTTNASKLKELKARAFIAEFRKFSNVTVKPRNLQVIVLVDGIEALRF